MTQRYSNLVTVLMVGCALTVTGLALHNQLRGTPSPQRLSAEAWGSALSRGRWIGDSLADVRIVEFADFQCPFCAELAPRLTALVRDSSGSVAVLFRHYPLERIHKHSLEAALAAECAAQLERFEAMHDALFELQDSIGVAPWRLFLDQAGIVDTSAFSRCLGSQTELRQVDADLAIARRFALPGTPVLMIEGRVLLGRQIDGLEGVVHDLLEKRRS